MRDLNQLNVNAANTIQHHGLWTVAAETLHAIKVGIWISACTLALASLVFHTFFIYIPTFGIVLGAMTGLLMSPLYLAVRKMIDPQILDRKLTLWSTLATVPGWLFVESHSPFVLMPFAAVGYFAACVHIALAQRRTLD